MIKLHDIAALAGVSISTVSRVINNDPAKAVSVETAQKVFKAAEKSGYFLELEKETIKKKNHAAKGMTIGCILASSEDTYQDPFFSSLLRGIHQQAGTLGFTIEYAFSYSEDNEQFLHKILTSKVDGIVLMGRMSSDQLGILSDRFPFLVYAGLNPVHRGIDQVVCDAYEATSTAMNYLFSLGHAKIGFLGQIPSSDHYNVINEYR